MSAFLKTVPITVSSDLILWHLSVSADHTLMSSDSLVTSTECELLEGPSLCFWSLPLSNYCICGISPPLATSSVSLTHWGLSRACWPHTSSHRVICWSSISQQYNFFDICVTPACICWTYLSCHHSADPQLSARGGDTSGSFQPSICWFHFKLPLLTTC